MSVLRRLIAPLRSFDSRHWHRWPALCAVLARIEAATMDGTCSERGCTREGTPCYFPDHADPHLPSAYYCWEHIRQSGFCRACGRFWAGVESFEVSRSKLCDDCQHEEDMEDAITRHFDEDDWNADIYGDEAM